ncbi:DUF1624 domain-containing protein [bacterium]|nr:MAG: DUF1624 domain-containing protein [bacterium]
MSAGRLKSLDVFRGLTIAGMVLVNGPGLDAAYAPLRHSRWDGCSAADLVFPFFLFIMGTALAFASARNVPGAPWGPVFRRAAVLVGLGLFLNAIPYWHPATFRFPGVLQRIAVCYLAAVAVQRRLSWRAQAWLAAALLVGYAAALRWVPVPGFGAGVLTPEGSLPSYVDRLLLGPHTYYQGPFDPEGFLSTLPAVVTVLLGGFAGAWLRGERSPAEKAAGLAAAGAVGVALGMLWAPVLPLNKALWSSSYVLYSGGWAALGLALCFWAFDVRGLRGTEPFEALGVNAILAYVAHILTLKFLVYTKLGGVSLRLLVCGALFGGWLPPMAASLAFALSHAALWAAALTPLHRRRIFLKA